MRVKRRWNPRNLIVFLVTILLTAGAINIFAGTSPTEASGNKTYVPIIVHAGDNLWNIAAARVPDQDPRKIVQEIMEINNLADVNIVPGEVLVVPAKK